MTVDLGRLPLLVGGPLFKMKCLERLICIYCGLIYFFGDLFRAGVVICALPRTSVEYDSITLNIHDDVESQQTGALQILDRVRRSDTSDKKCGVTGDTRADSVCIFSSSSN